MNENKRMKKRSIDDFIISCLEKVFESNLDYENINYKGSVKGQHKQDNRIKQSDKIRGDELINKVVIPSLKSQTTKVSDLTLHSLVVAYLSSRIVDLLVSKDALETSTLKDSDSLSVWEFRYYLIIGSLLHDHGKICWESTFFEKKSLGTYDWDVIKNHPIIGYNTLRTVFVPYNKAQISSSSLIPLRVILLHHKNYDWGGYPETIRVPTTPDKVLNWKTLKKEILPLRTKHGEKEYNIIGNLVMNNTPPPPLETRIVRIADSLAAMIEGRVYKRKTEGAALPLKEAIEDLKGTQDKGIENGEIIYDPLILRILLDEIEDLNWGYEEFIRECKNVKNEVAKGMSELL